MAIDFFDDIVCVSLVERTDRRMLMDEQMKNAGIPFRYFDAIKDDNGIKGLVESMKKLFRECLEKGNKNTLVLEDDAEFLVAEPVKFFEYVIPQLPKKYHLFFLGLNLLARPTRISENILKVVDSYSTHAAIYSREAMELCLQFLEATELTAYDIFLRQWILSMGNSYCTFPMMMTQRVGHSDIEKKNTDWASLMAQTFSMHTKNLVI